MSEQFLVPNRQPPPPLPVAKKFDDYWVFALFWMGILSFLLIVGSLVFALAGVL